MYSGSGPWTELFRKYPGYHGTLLLRDAENARRFLTVDRWESVAAREAMRKHFATAFEELERAGEKLTQSERRIGVFEEECEGG